MEDWIICQISPLDEYRQKTNSVQLSQSTGTLFVPAAWPVIFDAERVDTLISAMHLSYICIILCYVQDE